MFFKFLKHGSTWTYRLTTWLVMILGLGIATALLALRFFILPNIDEYRGLIVRSVASAIGQTVEIGRIEGNWRDYRPELRLFDVRVQEAGGQQTLALDRVDTVLSWRSLIARNIVFGLVEIAGPDLELRRDSLGTLWVAGTPIVRGEPGSRFRLVEWLVRQEEVVVRGARISWIDEMRAASLLVFDDVTIRMENAGSDHRFGITGKPPAELASAVRLSGKFSGDRFRDLSSWQGRMYGEFEYANLARAREWVSLPAELESGLGVLRLWMDVEGITVRRVVAEGNLVNVRGRLAPGLEPLALASLSGRLQWDEDATGKTIAISQLALQTVDGVRLPPARISIRKPHAGSQTELTLSSLELGPVAALSRSLPIDAAVMEKLVRLEPHGVVEDLRANWVAREGGEHAYQVNARFRGLAVKAVDEMPGFSGMNGTVALSGSGGTLSLKTDGATLELPRLYAEPIPFDYLNVDADWKVDEGRLQVTVRNASFTNEHAAGKAHGRYHFPGQGRGDIDLRVVLVRGEAQHVWRYFPLIIPKTHAWLKQGLVAGHSDDVRIHVEGPLDKFPFADTRDGTLEVKAVVRDAAVRIAENWPLIEGINGDFLMNGNRIDVKPRSAFVMGADVSQSQVSILGLNSADAHVSANFNAAGSVDQFLRFVAASPVAGYINGSTANMRGEGIGRLDLQLNLPLRSPADVDVDGHLDISGPRFSVDPRSPELTDYAVGIEIAKDNVMLRNGRAKMLGEALHFRSETRKKGTMEIRLAGAIDAENLATFSGQPLLRRLKGRAAWSGQLVFRQGVSRLHVTSTLVGIGSHLPPPLNKLEPIALPIEIDVWSRGDGNYECALDLAQVVNARWTSKNGVIGRGAVAFGGVAVQSERSGIGVRGEVGSFDLDGWQDVLAGGDSRDAGTWLDELASIDLKVGKLRFAGRSFRDLRIRGRRDVAALQFGIVGPQVDGTMVMLPNTNGGNRVNARFTSLALPSPEVSITAAPSGGQGVEKLKLPPALNVVVDDFRFEGRPLGRLELLAEPNADSWQLERLAISNPDGRADIKGQWRIVGRPHTEYTVRFEATDAGKFLRRLGYQETVVGGKGTLAGPVSWLGGPFRPDLPTLSGKMKLHASNGRFAQVDPGAAQLIGILSLQALPRRLTLNFKDVFSTGFRFDTIAADLTLAEGIVRTEDFRMEGVAAQVTMKGEVNLAAETQTLDIHVHPQLSGAAAVVGAAVVNPLVGVATFLVQKALGDPFEQIASRDYRVTGAWGSPQVERITVNNKVPASSSPVDKK